MGLCKAILNFVYGPGFRVRDILTILKLNVPLISKYFFSYEEEIVL